ncbi:hypothetical protein [Roseateles chitosanitabidus]|uniref:hypothetical protein n=1 Tax=Roseateles chitosanitabidus TaxID=65048 RepID=UPI00082CEA8B|nr:hypothetical protein [Roseateles chitosanitabidus]
MAKFNPNSFVDLAEELSGHQDQARLRTSISRAYYGVFLFARSIASVHSRQSDAHGLTRKYFEGIGATPIANALREMRALRNKADYSVERSFSKEVVAANMELAKRTRQEMRRLRGPRLKLYSANSR